MEEMACHEQYPAGYVMLSNLLTIFIYITGGLLVYLLNPFLAVAYVLFLLVLELRLLAGHCTECYYYGKRCAFGRGRLSAVLFRKGNPERFSLRKITWKDMIPDLLVLIIPVAAGIILLVTGFSWDVLILIVLLLILGSLGNGFVRGQLACRYCRQREIGCPAVEMFGEK